MKKILTALLMIFLGMETISAQSSQKVVVLPGINSTYGAGLKTEQRPMEEQVDFLIDKFKNLVQTDLVMIGHSQGGVRALAFANKNTQKPKGVITINSPVSGHNSMLRGQALVNDIDAMMNITSEGILGIPYAEWVAKILGIDLSKANIEEILKWVEQGNPGLNADGSRAVTLRGFIDTVTNHGNDAKGILDLHPNSDFLKNRVLPYKGGASGGFVTKVAYGDSKTVFCIYDTWCGSTVIDYNTPEGKAIQNGITACPKCGSKTWITGYKTIPCYAYLYVQPYTTAVIPSTKIPSTTALGFIRGLQSDPLIMAASALVDAKTLIPGLVSTPDAVITDNDHRHESGYFKDRRNLLTAVIDVYKNRMIDNINTYFLFGIPKTYTPQSILGFPIFPISCLGLPIAWVDQVAIDRSRKALDLMNNLKARYGQIMGDSQNDGFIPASNQYYTLGNTTVGGVTVNFGGRPIVNDGRYTRDVQDSEHLSARYDETVWGVGGSYDQVLREQTIKTDGIVGGWFQGQNWPLSNDAVINGVKWKMTVEAGQ